MIVCGHGNVKDFCDRYDMIIVEAHRGDLMGYCGICRVMVTDQKMSENEYLHLKKKMLSLGVELVSVEHTDMEEVAKHLVYTIQKENEDKRKHIARCMFGCKIVNGETVPDEKGMKIVRRILELRDKGYVYRMIQEDDGVHNLDGSKMSISKIAVICKNKEKYERM